MLLIRDSDLEYSPSCICRKAIPLEMLRKMEKPAVTPVHPIPTTIKRLTTLLLGDTDGSATATSGLGVLTTDTETPVVSETTVGADLLQALEILTELGVDTVGKDVGVLTIDDIALSVQEPGGDLVLGRVLDDGDDSLELLRGELTGAVKELSVLIVLSFPSLVGVLRVWAGFSYRLFRSTSAFLQTKLEYRRPTPLILVKAYITFCFPSTLVLRRRRICTPG